MKALSLTQPWASLVVAGIKRVETRSWSTKHRGRILIHASKAMPSWAREFAEDHGLVIGTEHRGAIIGAVTILDVRRVEDLDVPPLERELGDYSTGRYGWMLTEAASLPRPIVATGHLGLWEYELTEDLVRRFDIGRPEPDAAVLDRLERNGHARHGFCDRCWGNAYLEAVDTGRSQVEVYLERLAAVEASA